MASIQELERKILELESRLTEKNELFERLSMESRRAVDLALHAYRVDHYGYIWVYSPDDKLYHKTIMRVCTPEIADKAIQTRHLVSKCITSEKIADKAVTRDKLDDQVINDIRMLDLGDLFLGDYYTKEEVDGKLGGLDVDVDLTGYATEQWVQQQAYLKAEALANFYQKSEAYSRSEVDQIANTIKTGSFKSVQTLPEVSEAERNVIYLIPSSGGTSQNGEGTTGNVKDEFIVIEGDNGTLAWEQIGSTAIDLTGYVQKDELNIEAVKDRNDIVKITLGNGKTARVYVKYYDRNNVNVNDSDGLDINDLNASLQGRINSKLGKVSLYDGEGHPETVEDTVAIFDDEGGIKKSGQLLSGLAKRYADTVGKNTELLMLTKSGDYEPTGITLGDLQTLLEDLSVGDNDNDTDLVDIHIKDVEKTVATADWVNKQGFLKTLPSGVSAQIPSDWNQTDQNARDYIRNKPTIPTPPSSLSELSEDDQHMTVSDQEKATWNGKQDAIEDLEFIRSRAALGATAYQPMAIVAASGSALTAEVNKYYRFDNAVSTLTVTLPTVGETGKVQSLIVSLTTGSGTPSVSFVSADQNVQVLFFEGLSIDPGTSYEFNCMWNGKNWIVAYGVVA